MIWCMKRFAKWTEYFVTLLVGYGVCLFAFGLFFIGMPWVVYEIVFKEK